MGHNLMNSDKGLLSHRRQIDVALQILRIGAAVSLHGGSIEKAAGPTVLV